MWVGVVIWIFIGGKSYGKLGSVYKLESGVWTKLPDIEHPRWGHSCAQMGGEIFAIGGMGSSTSVEVLNVFSQMWREGPSLPADHYRDQAIVFDSVLYVLEEDDGTVVKLNLDEEWENVASIRGYP